MVKTIEWTEDGVRMIDQTRLPSEEVYRTCRDYREVADCIRSMVIRGAPAIGVAAAMGVALGVKKSSAASVPALRQEFEAIAETISKTRPTAVNLFWAVSRMRAVFESALEENFPVPVVTVAPGLNAILAEREAGAKIAARIFHVKSRLAEEAQRVLVEDIAANEAMGRHGAVLLQDASTVLTHCNAGALATGGYGTALGVIRAAVAAGKNIRVFADETRPFLQGARLTAWELAKDGIPVTLITDNMAGHFMHLGKIQAAIVGADRIASNGDVANKIGTYSVAVLAHENKIPFYVAAPLSTIDMSLASGEQIPIEERSSNEVTHVAGVSIAPQDVEARHPAFDVTPNRYVTAIITERGIARPPYVETLKALFIQ
ncbi:MAG TPA: S-methyl-5-thioribose-1-phosphate isomerase [Terriglobia bacterium]|nr:S-methyl-5-thioribose-1-phosphate isomerase [Terriglobia bacterium]